MNQDNQIPGLIHAGHSMNTDTYMATQNMTVNMESASFKVFGNCEMCKNRIEKAAHSLEGVNKAEWNIETKILNISYDGESVNLNQVHKTIAAIGHDTEQESAPDTVYKDLSACCLYRE